MKAPAKTRKHSEAPHLTRDHWLDAAFRAVAEGGFDKARVLILAKALGVTRGSFYWHFAGHTELIAALLSRWREREMTTLEGLRADSAPEPTVELERLLDAAFAHAGGDLQNLRFELALRGLGRRDPGVAKMLLEVDQARVEVFKEKFQRLAGDAKEAAELAALFYLAIVGSNQALSRPSTTPRMKQYLKGIIADYLIHRQVAKGARRKPRASA